MLHAVVVADELPSDCTEDADAQHIEHSTLTDHETYTDSCRVAGGTMTSLNPELSTSDCNSYHNKKEVCDFTSMFRKNSSLSYTCNCRPSLRLAEVLMGTLS